MNGGKVARAARGGRKGGGGRRLEGGVPCTDTKCSKVSIQTWLSKLMLFLKINYIRFIVDLGREKGLGRVWEKREKKGEREMEGEHTSLHQRKGGTGSL